MKYTLWEDPDSITSKTTMKIEVDEQLNLTPILNESLDIRGILFQYKYVLTYLLQIFWNIFIVQMVKKSFLLLCLMVYIK